MKNIIFITTLLALGWFGSSLYNQQGYTFIQDSLLIFKSKEQVKCITKEGRVLYGEIPKGIICDRIEPVKGSLTILPSKSAKNNNKQTFSSSAVRQMRTPSSFKCDGRTYCSEMNSCEEATFFLQNCQNIKMDGNNDGIPCEQQWCN
jgi:hypothetical protein